MFIKKKKKSASNYCIMEIFKFSAHPFVLVHILENELNIRDLFVSVVNEVIWRNSLCYIKIAVIV